MMERQMAIDTDAMPTGEWVQDTADYSWLVRDPDGSVVHLKKMMAPDGSWWWGYSWVCHTGRPYCASYLFKDVAEAKQRIAECILTEPATAAA